LVLTHDAALVEAERLLAAGERIPAGTLCRVAIERFIRQLAVSRGVTVKRFPTGIIVRVLCYQGHLPEERGCEVRRLLKLACKCAHGVDLGEERTAALVAGVRELMG
jgi:hypothetical protein